MHFALIKMITIFIHNFSADVVDTKDTNYTSVWLRLSSVSMVLGSPSHLLKGRLAKPVGSKEDLLCTSHTTNLICVEWWIFPGDFDFLGTIFLVWVWAWVNFGVFGSGFC